MAKNGVAMRRRALLGSLGAAMLAGCSSTRDTGGVDYPGRTTTAGYTGTTLSEPTPVPDPPGSPTPETAERFVREYERAVVYNDLLPGNQGDGEAGVDIEADPDGCEGVKSITIEDPVTRVLLADEPGVYVAASISGRAEYVCPGSDSASSGRNRVFDTHYVGPDRHVVVPYNAYACVGREEPYAGPESGRNATLDTDGDGHADAAPMKFQVYDVHPDAHAVTVRLAHVGSGDRVLAETYETDLALTVASNLAVRTGTYRLEARLGDGTSVAREFDVTGPSSAAWDGTCIYVTPRGDLRALTVDSTGALDVPTSRCHESLERARGTTVE